MGAYIVSLTSIPRRFDGALIQAVASLRRHKLPAHILINIPKRYRKWGEANIPAALRSLEGITIFSPSSDYGPATKLLGAIEYAEGHPEISHVITVDDDIVFADPEHLQRLVDASERRPEYAITVGGILLQHFPFRNGDGLKYDSGETIVHIPAGYRGVVYPLTALRVAGRFPFDFVNSLPSGIFHDDDAYFGLLLARLGVPLYAIAPNREADAQEVALSGGSAVTEFADKERVENEMEIFQYAVRNGIIKPRPEPSMSRLVRRLWKVGRRLGLPLKA